jgi:hypothetical protein
VSNFKDKLQEIKGQQKLLRMHKKAFENKKAA